MHPAASLIDYIGAKPCGEYWLQLRHQTCLEFSISVEELLARQESKSPPRPTKGMQSVINGAEQACVYEIEQFKIK